MERITEVVGRRARQIEGGGQRCCRWEKRSKNGENQKLTTVLGAMSYLQSVVGLLMHVTRVQ